MKNLTLLFAARLLALFSLIFTVSCGPKIESFSSEYGEVGSEVTIEGKRLVDKSDLTTTVISINGVNQPYFNGNNNELKFRVTEGTTTGKIKISTPMGSAISSEEFQLVDNFEDEEGQFTFGGLSVMAAKIAPSGTDQEILFGILRTKWAPVTGVFDDFDDIIDGEFTYMNDFWTETSFGKASFTKNYLTNTVIPLPKSKDFYYHTEQQRDIKGSALPPSINFPADKTLTIEYSPGDSFDIEFTAGTISLADIEILVNDALDAVEGAPPQISFSQTLSRFRVRSTVPDKIEGHIELSGDALPYLGFGNSTLYNLSGNEPKRVFFSAPIDTDEIQFGASNNLIITTLGESTNVNFETGIDLNINDVINAIFLAFPGVSEQQPFQVVAIPDPSNTNNTILVINTVVDSDGDHGFDLTIGGNARATLGLDVPGDLQSYEPETFNGRTAIRDGFNNYAATLPAGTDLDAVYGNAGMFVGVLTDDNQLRAHHSSWTFPIQDDTFEVNYFVARISSIGAFAHETGHALGLPDLYKVNPNTDIGNVPDNWDIMDCSRCDAHSVQWLKSRHHEEPEDQGGAWIDAGHIAIINPPLGNASKTIEYILSPVESPWISSNPFSTSHPGIEIVQGIELVPTDPKDVFFLENRQKGTYKADHLGDQVDFSQDLPGEGIIMYQGRRLPPSGLVDFIPVNLLTPYSNPLNIVGESYEQIITNSNKITVTVVDKILNPDSSGGAPSFSYHVSVVWGQGSFFDLAIKEWNPPPWESEDIWIDNRAENDWDEYTYEDSSGEPILNGDNVQVGKPNRLIARIRNLGDIPVTDNFQIIWRIAVPQKQGSITTELGRVTVTEDVPANGSIKSPPLNWTPTDSNKKHVCIKAEIVTVPGELNGTLNNSAQENFKQWYSGSSSPFETISFEFETENPYNNKSENILLDVKGVRPGWTVSVEDVSFRLPPNGKKKQKVTITPILGYFEDRNLIRINKGFIPPLEVNIEAQVPFGDTWRTFGGITALVHPVNANSTITLNSKIRESSDGTVTVEGTLSSAGPLYPQLGNRKINLSIKGVNGDERWKQTFSTGAQFSFDIPNDLRWQDLLVKAYHSGGTGFKPSRSNDLLISKIKNTSPEPPNFGGLLDILVNNNNLGTLSSMVMSGKIKKLLLEGEYTLFAGTDVAFKGLSPRVMLQLQQDPEFRDAFLSDFMVYGDFKLDDIDNVEELKTVSGKTITISKRNNTVYFNNVRLRPSPLQTKNGTIYLIDRF